MSRCARCNEPAALLTLSRWLPYGPARRLCTACRRAVALLHVVEMYQRRERGAS